MSYVSTEVKNLIFAMNNNRSNISTLFAKYYSAEDLQKLINELHFYLANILINEDADDVELLMLMAQTSLITK